MLFLNSLNKTYKNNTKDDVEFKLDNISFTIPNNSMTFILGKSGCGKSTLLHLLGAMDKADSGSIVLNGRDITKLSNDELCSYRNASVGFVFQNFNLINDFNVFDNVALSLDLQNKKHSSYEKDVLSVIERVGLKGFEKRKVCDLSGGQKQRVAIARAIIKKPELLLCDEPTGALDKKTAKEIFNLLKTISKETIVVVVTHDSESASTYGDSIIELEDGRLKKDYPTFDIGNEEVKKIENSKISDSFAFAFSKKRLFKRKATLFLSILVASIAIALTNASLSFKHESNEQKLISSMLDNQINYFSVEKEEHWTEHNGLYFYNKFSYEEFEDFNSYTGLNADYVIYNRSTIETFLNDDFYEYRGYFRNDISDFLEISNKKIKDYNLKLISGKIPTNPNEIAISKHLYDCFEINGYKLDDIIIEHPTIEQMVGSTIEVVNNEFVMNSRYVVTGIIDTNLNSKYTLDYYLNLEKDYTLGSHSEEQEYIKKILSTELHNCLFVMDGFYNATKIPFNERNYYNCNLKFAYEKKSDTTYFDGFRLLKSSDEYYQVSNTSSSLNKAVVPFAELNKMTDDKGVKLFALATEKLLQKDNIVKNITNCRSYSDYLDEYNIALRRNGYESIELNDFIPLLNNELLDNFIGRTIQSEYSSTVIQIEGIHCLKNENESSILLSDATIELIKNKSYGYFDDFYRLIVPFNNVESGIKAFKKIYSLRIEDTIKYEEDNVFLYSTFNTKSAYLDQFNATSNAIEYLNIYIVVLICIMFVISLTFIFFFFVNLISKNHKDYGIIQCLGAKKKDVVKIIGVQVAIYSFISIIASTVLSFSLFYFVEKKLFKDFSDIKYFSFGWDMVYITLAMFVIATLLSFVFSLTTLNSKKPIELVKNDE